MKTTLTNSEYKVSSTSEPEKLKIIKLTLDQEKSLQSVVAKLADTSEWPLHFLDYQYKVCCFLWIDKNIPDFLGYHHCNVHHKK